jgi:hypothetical protein
MSSPGVPTFLNESLRKTAMQNANNFKRDLEKIINEIVEKNLENIQKELENSVLKNSCNGITEFTFGMRIDHYNYNEYLIRNTMLSIKLLSEKYSEKLDSISIKLDQFNRDSHTIRIPIKID